MKHSVLVVGSGGREHAIVRALSRSPQVQTIYCAPGNAGIADQAECVPIADTDMQALLNFAVQHHIDLTVVGPEAALAAGIVDLFRQHGLTIFGHTRSATQIESSKLFAKQLMARHHIPTADYCSFSDYNQAIDYVRLHGFPIVLKYDGLAAGKGVVIAQSFEEADRTLRDMLVSNRYGQDRVVIEQYLTGPEFSFMCFVCGEHVYPMPLSQDHKRAFDGDSGPNTGGMGAYTPLPFITDEDRNYTLTHILQPVAKAMTDEGLPLTGVLYAGLMKTPDGIRVIEFNARFGDPETEVVLPLLISDAYDLLHAIASSYRPEPIHWHHEAVLGVVLASKGYPGHYEKSVPIFGLDACRCDIIHMGTRCEGDQLLTNGGRVLMCVASAPTIEEARRCVYDDIAHIQCSNLFYRTDIAYQGVEYQKSHKVPMEV